MQTREGWVSYLRYSASGIMDKIESTVEDRGRYGRTPRLTATIRARAAKDLQIEKGEGGRE